MRIIAGSARGFPLVGPKGRTTRPALDSLRESIFAILGARVEGARVLDLFAGVGAFGLEALSRGARSATFVEQDRAALEALERNIAALHFGVRSRVSRGDALLVPRASEVGPDEPFDLLFVDPPFALFTSEDDARRLFARVRELLEPPFGSEDATLVLRLPAPWRRERPFPAAR